MTRSETNNKIEEKKDIDPVCGMSVIPGETKLVSIHDGISYWFCAKACREAFDNNPMKYLKPKKRKGIWGRYLDRLSRATGGKPLKCC
ncbi:YHS domain-containing protein [Thermodesulfobacteriota bacterium]